MSVSGSPQIWPLVTVRGDLVSEQRERPVEKLVGQVKTVLFSVLETVGATPPHWSAGMPMNIQVVRSNLLPALWRLTRELRTGPATRIALCQHARRFVGVVPAAQQSEPRR